MKKIPLSFLLLVCILFGITLSLNLLIDTRLFSKISSSQTYYEFEKKNIKNLKYSSYGNDSIVIESDADFETYGFIGTGTENDPYLIENIIINNTDMYSRGICITGTTKYFIIRNCTIDVNVYGVYIYEISSGTAKIINNTIFSCYFGISIQNASETSIINNTITRYRRGTWPFMYWEITIASIRCRFSNNLKILNNTCTNAYDTGIYLDLCNFVDIIKTRCRYSSYGILFRVSSYINVYNCIFAYHWHSGIELSSGSPEYITIINNKFEESGISVGISSFPLTLENNTVNGKPLVCFEHRSGLNLNKPVYGQIILYKCHSIEISNQVMEECCVGLILLDCDNLIITNNSLFYNYYGISIYACSQLLVSNNTCSFNYYGISIYASYSLFSNNNFSFNYRDGVKIFSSWHLEFSKNICNDNYESGIFFDGNVGYYRPHDNLIFNNKIMRNGDGIYIWYTDNTEIRYNLIQDNIGFGMGIGMNSEGNVVHHNKFINNCINTGNPQGCQDYGESPNNLWYNISTEEGNYWSDWNGTGPYRIFTYGGEVYDLYPLYELDLPNGEDHQEEPISSIGSDKFLFLAIMIFLFTSLAIKRIKYNNKT